MGLLLTGTLHKMKVSIGLLERVRSNRFFPWGTPPDGGGCRVASQVLKATSLEPEGRIAQTGALEAELNPERFNDILCPCAIASRDRIKPPCRAPPLRSTTRFQKRALSARAPAELPQPKRCTRPASRSIGSRREL